MKLHNVLMVGLLAAGCWSALGLRPEQSYGIGCIQYFDEEQFDSSRHLYSSMLQRMPQEGLKPIFKNLEANFYNFVERNDAWSATVFFSTMLAVAEVAEGTLAQSFKERIQILCQWIEERLELEEEKKSGRKRGLPSEGEDPKRRRLSPTESEESEESMTE